ncbi:MAG TPA: glycosyltransferase [Sandaracinaceae bacterium LLY-WYZ-13_1]|nr:glycosyltransferase [Sandaracinaceae bacterium LLY-WYZ-13_1]
MRIFVTVGAQMPFDRLVAAVDRWAGEHPAHHVVAQIGKSELEPTHLDWRQFLQPPDFDRAFDEADAIVGHAGTGTLFAAMERGTPILVMPRRAALHETRNDHQVATAKRFERFDGISVAWDEIELPARLDELPSLQGAAVLAHDAEGPLIETVAAFIDRD